MNTGELTKKSVLELSKLLQNGETSSAEITQTFLSKIKDRDGGLGAFLEIFDDAAQQANLADEKIENGETGKLLGIPIAIKDNILIHGRTASAASKILENYTASYNSDVAEKLFASGAVFLGRTNMDEFAMGSSTEHSAFQLTRNPLDHARVPGGSSGGSAAAVAAGLIPAALGSDTGGSIRQPASFCGIVGLKPTYGSVSRYGLMSLGSSLDCIGPLTQDVDDAEHLFKIISGYDARDATSVADESRICPTADNNVVGVIKNLVEHPGVSQSVRQNFYKSMEELSRVGYDVVDVAMPTLENSLAIYYIIQPAEASSNLARYDGIRYGKSIDGADLLEKYMKTRGELLGTETKRRILVGTHMLSAGYFDAYYRRANTLREKMRQEIKDIFEKVSILATPTTPTTTFPIGTDSDPLEMYAADLFTVFANLAGVPAISIPFGHDSDGLAFGTQFVAPHFCEDRLFQIGKSLESRL